MANHLFKYLVENAKKAEDTAVTYPRIDQSTTELNQQIDSEYYTIDSDSFVVDKSGTFEFTFW